MAKRNKTSTGRSGVSPYRRHGKRPCPHCQDITRADRRAAERGESRALPDMSPDYYEGRRQ